MAVLWGVAFVATRIGLDELSPAQLAIARSAIAAAPVFVVARPRVPWSGIVAVGRLAGMALVLGGLAVIVVPGREAAA